MNEPDQKEIEEINNMSREEMCRLWCNARIGHPYFDCLKPYYAIFKARFEKLGGFSPGMSKKIGWGSIRS